MFENTSLQTDMPVINEVFSNIVITSATWELG